MSSDHNGSSRLQRPILRNYEETRTLRLLKRTMSCPNLKLQFIKPVKRGLSSLMLPMTRKNAKASPRHSHSSDISTKKDVDVDAHEQPPNWPYSKFTTGQSNLPAKKAPAMILGNDFDSNISLSTASSTVPSRSSSPCPSETTELTDPEIEESQYVAPLKHQGWWYPIQEEPESIDQECGDLSNPVVAGTSSTADTGEKKRIVPAQDNEGQANKRQSRPFPNGDSNREDDHRDRKDDASLDGWRKDRITDSPPEERYFSCPYRKRNPIRFNVRDHSSCATKKLKGVSELMEHIRTVHRRQIFLPDANSQPEDGITQEIGNISDWNTLWGVLFPADRDIPSKEFIPPIELEEVVQEFQGCLNILDSKVKQEIRRLLPTLHNQIQVSSGMFLIFKVFIAETFLSCHTKYRRALCDLRSQHAEDETVNGERFSPNNPMSCHGSVGIDWIPEMPRSLEVSIQQILTIGVPASPLPPDQINLSPASFPLSNIRLLSYPTWVLFSSDLEQELWNMGSGSGVYRLETFKSDMGTTPYRYGANSILLPAPGHDPTTQHVQSRLECLVKITSLGSTITMVKGPALSNVPLTHGQHTRANTLPADSDMPSAHALDHQHAIGRETVIGHDGLVNEHPLEISEESGTLAKTYSPKNITEGFDVVTRPRLELDNDLVDDIIKKVCDILIENIYQQGDDMDALTRVVETAVISLVNDLAHLLASIPMISCTQGVNHDSEYSPSSHGGSNSQPHSQGGSRRGVNGQNREFIGGGGDDRGGADDPSAPGGDAAVDSAPHSINPPPFSCPYRKRNPLRFNVRDYHGCAAKGWKDLSLLKRHIMSSHTRENRCVASFFCTRCKQGFNTEIELEAHGRLPPCQYTDPSEDVPGDPEDGITESVVRKLKARDVTRVRTWPDLWKLLFPNDTEVPSQVFVPPDGAEDIRRDLHRIRPKMEVQFETILRNALLFNTVPSIVSQKDRLIAEVYRLIESVLNRHTISARHIPEEQAQSLPPSPPADLGSTDHVHSRKRPRVEDIQQDDTDNLAADLATQLSPRYRLPGDAALPGSSSSNLGPSAQQTFAPHRQIGFGDDMPLLQLGDVQSYSNGAPFPFSLSPVGGGSEVFTPNSNNDVAFTTPCPYCSCPPPCICTSPGSTQNAYPPFIYN